MRRPGEALLLALRKGGGGRGSKGRAVEAPLLALLVSLRRRRRGRGSTGRAGEAPLLALLVGLRRRRRGRGSTGRAGEALLHALLVGLQRGRMGRGCAAWCSVDRPCAETALVGGLRLGCRGEGESRGETWLAAGVARLRVAGA